MTKRRCFYSFHYENDAWRTSQVRNIGKVEGNEPTTGNHWEEIKRGGVKAIQRWIDSEMKGRTCTIVLIGTKTANRPWINYEIKNSWKRGMGIAGIYVHGLLDADRKECRQGDNPFRFAFDSHLKKPLSSVVECYNPKGRDSKERYGWIGDHIEGIVEEAIEIRNSYAI